MAGIQCTFAKRMKGLHWHFDVEDVLTQESKQYKLLLEEFREGFMGQVAPQLGL